MDREAEEPAGRDSRSKGTLTARSVVTAVARAMARRSPLDASPGHTKTVWAGVD